MITDASSSFWRVIYLYKDRQSVMEYDRVHSTLVLFLLPSKFHSFSTQWRAYIIYYFYTTFDSLSGICIVWDSLLARWCTWCESNTSNGLLVTAYPLKCTQQFRRPSPNMTNISTFTFLTCPNHYCFAITFKIVTRSYSCSSSGSSSKNTKFSFTRYAYHQSLW